MCSISEECNRFEELCPIFASFYFLLRNETEIVLLLFRFTSQNKIKNCSHHFA